MTLPTPPPSPGPQALFDPESRLGFVLAGTYRLTHVLGVGAYGTVYRAQDIHTGVEYAVKALNKLGLDSRQRRFQEREIRLHHRAGRHENVVSLEKILDSPECTYVVIEYCAEGDLFSKITEQGRYIRNDFRARHAFDQILKAVKHCHDRSIYHRDLKPENILVAKDGFTVKLADFGLATSDPFTSDFGCGSTFYMSPECQQQNPQPHCWYASAPNDVWALGVILVNLTCGRNPWKRACMSDPTYKAYIRDRDFLKTILPITDELNYILQRIFEPDFHKRITLEQLQILIGRFTNFTTKPVNAVANELQTPPDSPEEAPFDYDGAVIDETVDSIPQLEQLPAPRFAQVAVTQSSQHLPPSDFTYAPRTYQSACANPSNLSNPWNIGSRFGHMLNLQVPPHFFTVTR